MGCSSSPAFALWYFITHPSLLPQGLARRLLLEAAEGLLAVGGGACRRGPRP